jgi:hypothetical protein
VKKNEVRINKVEKLLEEAGVILFLLSAIAVLLIEIIIYIYIRRIKLKSTYKEG